MELNDLQINIQSIGQTLPSQCVPFLEAMNNAGMQEIPDFEPKY